MLRLAPIALVALAVTLLALASPAKTGADQPIQLWLPWEGGTLWTYTQGPHGQNLEALDFQPPDAAGKPCDIFHSSFWVVAAADGTVTDGTNLIEIDHGNGFSSVYYHLENKQVKTGDHVSAGDRLGAPGCCPDGSSTDSCESEAPHVHFYVKQDGERLPAFGLNLGGWRVGDDGCLARTSERSCPLEGGATATDAIGRRIVSNSPRHGQDEPSTPADIAVIIDASADSAPGQATRQDAALALLQATRPDDRVAVIQAMNSTARLAAPLTPATEDGAVSGKLIDAINEPGEGGPTNLRLAMVNACAELLANGKAPARAAVLLSDGYDNMGGFSGAQECFQEAGIPVFVYGIGRANRALLQELADKTGGQFARLADIDNLYCEFRRVRTIISGDPAGNCSTFQLQQNEALTLPFQVPPDQDQAVLEIRWRDRRTAQEAAAAGVPVDSQIRSPSGTLVKLPMSGVTVTEEDGTVRYTIAYPRDGEWKLVVTLNDKAPAEGLFITFSASTITQASPFVDLSPSPTEEPTPDATTLPDTETPEPTPTPTARPSRTVAPTPDKTVPPTDSATPTLEPTPKVTPTPDPKPTP